MNKSEIIKKYQEDIINSEIFLKEIYSKKIVINKNEIFNLLKEKNDYPIINKFIESNYSIPQQIQLYINNQDLLFKAISKDNKFEDMNPYFKANVSLKFLIDPTHDVWKENNIEQIDNLKEFKKEINHHTNFNLLSKDMELPGLNLSKILKDNEEGFIKLLKKINERDPQSAEEKLKILIEYKENIKDYNFVAYFVSKVYDNFNKEIGKNENNQPQIHLQELIIDILTKDISNDNRKKIENIQSDIENKDNPTISNKLNDLTV